MFAFFPPPPPSRTLLLPAGPRCAVGARRLFPLLLLLPGLLLRKWNIQGGGGGSDVVFGIRNSFPRNSVESVSAAEATARPDNRSRFGSSEEAAASGGRIWISRSGSGRTTEGHERPPPTFTTLHAQRQQRRRRRHFGSGLSAKGHRRRRRRCRQLSLRSLGRRRPRRRKGGCHWLAAADGEETRNVRRARTSGDLDIRPRSLLRPLKHQIQKKPPRCPFGGEGGT